MHIIFLDIDGVLNCETTKERLEGQIGLCPKRIRILNRITEATHAKIVINSAWQSIPAQMQHIFESPITGVMLGTTPPPDASGSNYNRKARRAAAWLARHPEVTRHALIEDGCDPFEGITVFETTWRKGLTDKIADTVIAHLNG